MPRDKSLHLLAGLALSIAAGLFTCPAVGLAMSVVAGVMKELVWDRAWRRGTPEWLDMVATVAGGVVGYLILAVMR